MFVFDKSLAQYSTVVGHREYELRKTWLERLNYKDNPSMRVFLNLSWAKSSHKLIMTFWIRVLTLEFLRFATWQEACTISYYAVWMKDERITQKVERNMILLHFPKPSHSLYQVFLTLINSLDHHTKINQDAFSISFCPYFDFGYECQRTVQHM